MEILQIHILKSIYDTYANIIDQYIISHQINTIAAVGNEVRSTIDIIIVDVNDYLHGKHVMSINTYASLKISASNLCDLWNKLGNKFSVNYLTVRDKLVPCANPEHFIKHIVADIQGSTQLVSTISNIYKDTYTFDSEDLFCQYLKAKDPNVWRCISLEHINRYGIIRRLGIIFAEAKTDSHIEAAIEYLKILDKFVAIDDSTYDDGRSKEHRLLMRCINNSLSKNCPKMRSLLLKSDVFNVVGVTFEQFLNALIIDDIDAASELLVKVPPEYRRFNQSHTITQRNGLISSKCVAYLFDLLSNDRIELDETSAGEFAYTCASACNYNATIYILAHYPLCVTRSFIDRFKRVIDNLVLPEFEIRVNGMYAEELEKMLEINEELEKEI